MRIDPSPDDFYAAFLQAANTERDALLAKWFDNQGRTLTLCSSLFSLAKELGMHYLPEYRWLDVALYHERDDVNFPEPTWCGSAYPKYVYVAIELENDHTYVVDEMSKLQLANVPLGVV